MNKLIWIYLAAPGVDSVKYTGKNNEQPRPPWCTGTH